MSVHRENKVHKVGSVHKVRERRTPAPHRTLPTL